jgi:CDP-diacylglycerol--glycerol-3-phosphate 3-phosphatidyltransferase
LRLRLSLVGELTAAGTRVVPLGELMASEWLRDRSQGWVTWLAALVNRAGLSPTALTILGFIFNLAVAVVLAAGHLVLGGVLVILASLFDTLDGAVARYSGRVTHFGAFLDSTLDRGSEAALYLGLLYYYARQNSMPEILLIYLTIVGSTMVSYTRARAEGIGVACKVGWFTRFERIAVLVIGLLLQQMTTALIVLAVGSALTTVQRILHVQRQLASEGH